eukprot:TRINITY_DN879_c0_g1_i1.p1 TRINITY_DN879_c0_g1~~TRINITY_DN879_c0_g1_i1.p1  ORF type:complete len:427 (+),score=123.26 TRINITY_DN879_c0_g1_i1:56-1282(+)
MNFLYFVVAFCIISLVQCEVIQINKKNSNLLTESPCIVMFGASYCVHCKKFKPNFMKIDEKLKGSTIIPYYVDIEKNKDIRAKYSVKRFPTIMFINKTEYFPYEQARNIDSIATFCRNLENINIDEHKEEKIIVRSKTEFVLCNRDPNVEAEVKKVARRYHQHLFFTQNTDKDCKSDEITVIRKDTTFSKKIDFETLLKDWKKFESFFTLEMFPLITELSPSTFKPLAALNRKIVIFIIDETFDKFKEKFETFEAQMNEYSSLFTFTFLVGPMQKHYISNFYLTLEDLPATVVLDVSNNAFWKFSGIEIDSLSGILSGEIKPFKSDGNTSFDKILTNIRRLAMEEPLKFFLFFIIFSVCLVFIILILSCSSIKKIKEQPIKPAPVVEEELVMLDDEKSNDDADAEEIE